LLLILAASVRQIKGSLPSVRLIWLSIMDEIKQVLTGSVALHLCEKGPWVLYSINIPCSLVSKAELRGVWRLLKEPQPALIGQKRSCFLFSKTNWTGFIDFSLPLAIQAFNK
jgi:hypothetical protein